MHSRIFQISSKPINKDEYITEANYDYDDWFLREIADYVDDIGESYQKETLEWLGMLDGISVDVDRRTVTVESKADFFLQKYVSFKNILKELEKISLKDFSTPDRHSFDYDMYRLNSCHKDKYGFYVDDSGEYGGLVTLDEWMRYAAVEGETYYIGGIVDYHS